MNKHLGDWEKIRIDKDGHPYEIRFRTTGTIDYIHIKVSRWARINVHSEKVKVSRSNLVGKGMAIEIRTKDHDVIQAELSLLGDEDSWSGAEDGVFDASPVVLSV